MPAIIIYVSAPIIPEIRVVIERAALSFVYLNVAFVLSAVLDAANDIYMTFQYPRQDQLKDFCKSSRLLFIS